MLYNIYTIHQNTNNNSLGLKYYDTFLYLSVLNL